jgi:hypothetical protein
MNPRHSSRFVSVILNIVAVLFALPAFADPLGVMSNPLREAYYGDLHLHTSYSLDAYFGGLPPVDPDEAYRFAQGQVVNYLGEPVQRREALDFMAVTDHAESLGVVNELDDPDSAVSRSEMGKAFLAIMARMRGPDGRLDTELLVDQPKLAAELWNLEQVWGFGRKNNLPEDLRRVSATAWAREIEFANRNYQPGKFTTFVAYEWTPTPYGANLHRNVIFRGDAAPYPFAAQDSTDPEDLWDWMDAIRQQGFEAIAIPHNGNASNGLMYNWIDSSGGSLDRRYAEARQAHEPVSEIMQRKGQSETHPLLSPNDEFADFEIFDYLADAWSGQRQVKGSYLRDALSRGLVLQRQLGVNPFKYGFVGASDLHGGLSVSAQEDYAGNSYLVNLGGGKPAKAEAASILDVNSQRVEATLGTTTGSLTGVWAESNTRESIYAALSRRETFATSGTRLRFRFFGSWAFDNALLLEPDWVSTAYSQGVPMGGDLPQAPAEVATPTFALWVLKDPNGANLDRAQIIKVWEVDGEQREKVFEVAWAGDRQPDPATGKLPPLGDSVDLNTGTVSQDIGAVELRAVWQDPEFDPHRFAAYYLRVLEIPTPRWSTLLAIQNGLPLPGDAPALIQQRGWSSPIWYAPPDFRHGSV